MRPVRTLPARTRKTDGRDREASVTRRRTCLSTVWGRRLGGGPVPTARYDGPVNWTVAVRMRPLRSLPPLPAGLGGKMVEALAKAAAQQPEWPGPEAVRRVRTVLESVPPITVPQEIDRLRQR